MQKARKQIHYGKETDVFYLGMTTGAFAPSSSGITFPDPTYNIYRSFSGIYVFEYVISGKGHISHDGQQFAVSAGDAYILHQGHEHAYYPDENDPWLKIWFNASGSLVRHLLADYELDNTIVIPGFRSSQHLDEIFRSMKEDPFNCREQLSVLLHQYIIALADFCSQQNDVQTQAVAMKKYIERSLTLPLSIDELADSVHLSRSRALYLFKETYGITPYRYYLSQRLELAQSMLQQSSLSIQEISDRLGFIDYRHFSGFFKKECGISPTQYRAQAR